MEKRPEILLIRHQRAALRTRANLAVQGYKSTIFPLSEIENLQNPLPSGEFDAVIFTSPLGPRVLKQNPLIEQLTNLPVYCVGEYTAGCAIKAGFRVITNVSADAKTLGRAVNAAQAANFLYPCAKNHSYDFAAQLSSVGKSCTNWQIYSNNLLFPDHQKLLTALTATEVVFLFSKRTAGHFFDITDTTSGHLALSNRVFVTISQNVAAAVPRKFCSDTYIASDKNETSMIKCLQEISDKQ
ncbi:MAG: uroporphyrinogen-III synthase [Rhizobiaceae bacterium]|nr:uroporphyrinogen-III synthase [Rhizobiaceae bacterium]